MDISEVAKRAGVAASRLRFYEEKGLIQSVGRRGQRRVFAAEVLDQLAFIALGQAAGFSLDEIRPMLAQGSEPAIDRQQLLDKAQQLDQTIRQLSAMRDGLQHAAACSAPSHMQCPTFRRLLGLAAEGVISAPSVVPRCVSL